MDRRKYAELVGNVGPEQVFACSLFVPWVVAYDRGEVPYI